MTIKQPSKFEKKVRLVTHIMNHRGFLIDVDRVEKMLSIAELIREKKRAELLKVTGEAVEKETQGARMMTWLEKLGVIIPVVEKKDSEDRTVFRKSLDADSVLELLDSEIPEAARTALSIKQDIGLSSLGKLNKLLDMVCADGRVRGSVSYCGAEMTARWSGKGFQPQNLPRGIFKGESDYDMALSWIEDVDIEGLAMWYGEKMIMKVLSSCIRNCMIASPGKQLVVADYKNIEGRVVMWLAGQMDILKAYTEGLDAYKVVAAKYFHTEYESVTSYQRAFGKVQILAGNYQMGGDKFQDKAAEYGIELTNEESHAAIKGYRETIPEVVKYWKGLETAAKKAIKNPGCVFRYRSIKFQMKDRNLLCRLPSGRCLHYNRARLRISKVHMKKKDGTTKTYERESIAYYMVRDGRATWMDTYGGKLCENITQAVSRDLMAGALIRCEDRGYDPVTTVHDEAVCDTDLVTEEELCACLIEEEPWAKGLPLEAEGWSGQYYRK